MSPDWQIRAAMGVMVLYFGSSFTAYAAAEESFGFVTINAGRFVLASLLLLAISRGRLATVRHVRGRLLLAGDCPASSGCRPDPVSWSAGCRH